MNGHEHDADGRHGGEDDEGDQGGHDHGGHDHTQASRRALAIALAINTAFLVVEVGGAVLADSLTLLADAVHMLTDSASLGLALFAAWVATRPADRRRTYGYQRAEVIGALVNGLLLVAAVGYVLLDAYRRFQDPRPVDPFIVVGVGVVGLGANLAAAWALSSHRETLNVEGAFLHLVFDAAGSVAAIVAGLVIWQTGLYVVDPIFALLIAALVLYSTRDLLADSLNVLLQGTPRDVDLGEVVAALEAVDGVADAHHVHVWSLDSRRTALSAHLVVEEGVDRDDVLGHCRQGLADRFGIDHATIQLESPGFAETVELECYPATSD